MSCFEEVRIDNSADDNETELDEYVFERPEDFVELSIKRIRELNDVDNTASASVVALTRSVVALRPVVGDAGLFKLSIVYGENELFHECILRFPAPVLPGGVSAFQENDSIFVCAAVRKRSFFFFFFFFFSQFFSRSHHILFIPCVTLTQ